MSTVAEFRIRAAVPSDAAEIARLAGELGYPADARQMHERLCRLLQIPTHFIAVAEQDRVLGWIHAEQRFILEYGERAELDGLVVGGTARRAGVATSLVASAERWAKSRGLSSIMVCSNVTRADSHPFYEALGYVRRKTQHVYARALSGPS